MREMSVTLGSKTLTLRANFAASVKIAKQVGDPLFIARETALESIMMERGISYTPKFSFNLDNIVTILEIGATTFNDEVKRSEIEDLVFEAGLYPARGEASEYIAMIIGPTPEVAEEGPEAKKDSGKK